MKMGATQETSKKVYYCSFTDRPLGFEKHIWNRIRYGSAHFFGSYAIIKLLTFQYNWTMLPFSEFHIKQSS
jgi:hypothetical protein